MREARRICHENNCLFMVDEVQTGCARTGKLLATDYDEVSDFTYTYQYIISSSIFLSFFDQVKPCFDSNENPMFVWVSINSILSCHASCHPLY